MTAGIFNKIKMCMAYPKKNIELAENPELSNFIYLLSEQLIPQWCQANMNKPDEINKMHNLVYLLAQKVHQIFQARVIHQIIDQNWDLKGFRAVIMRILETLKIQSTPQSQDLDKFIEKMITFQNMQSSSCIKAIGSFLRKPKDLDANKDDLSNPIKTYQTTFEFLRYDIERYREQNIKYQCFQVLHPWAYDLDQVDMKYIVNPNLEAQICQELSESRNA